MARPPTAPEASFPLASSEQRDVGDAAAHHAHPPKQHPSSEQARPPTAAELQGRGAGDTRRGDTAEASTSAVNGRIEQLLHTMRPTRASEQRRGNIAGYMRSLIRKCFAPEYTVDAFMFGSVPLKTYLPDGDIDLSAFQLLPPPSTVNLKDAWASRFVITLEEEQKNPNAPFKISDILMINAEVKLLKCVVDDIVVDVSFNQLGGLCTLSFLECVDRKIGKQHLFKRSIVLVKAWCYYESRLLGAHHALISTYALETLVLFVFNAWHRELLHPLQVLQKFLDVFSVFDWDNCCACLEGRVPMSSIPNSVLEPPPGMEGDYLLDDKFVQQMLWFYTPGSPQKGERIAPLPSHGFMTKFLNISDVLLPNNNLGRSVSRSSFARIRKAFGHGAKSLRAVTEQGSTQVLDHFFRNTWAALNGRRINGNGGMPSMASTAEGRAQAMWVQQAASMMAMAAASGNYIMPMPDSMQQQVSSLMSTISSGVPLGPPPPPPPPRNKPTSSSAGGCVSPPHRQQGTPPQERPTWGRSNATGGEEQRHAEQVPEASSSAAVTPSAAHPPPPPTITVGQVPMPPPPSRQVTSPTIPVPSPPSAAHHPPPPLVAAMSPPPEAVGLLPPVFSSQPRPPAREARSQGSSPPPPSYLPIPPHPAMYFPHSPPSWWQPGWEMMRLADHVAAGLYEDLLSGDLHALTAQLNIARAGLNPNTNRLVEMPPNLLSPADAQMGTGVPPAPVVLPASPDASWIAGQQMVGMMQMQMAAAKLSGGVMQAGQTDVAAATPPPDAPPPPNATAAAAAAGVRAQGSEVVAVNAVDVSAASRQRVHLSPHAVRSGAPAEGAVGPSHGARGAGGGGVKGQQDGGKPPLRSEIRRVNSEPRMSQRQQQPHAHEGGVGGARATGKNRTETGDGRGARQSEGSSGVVGVQEGRQAVPSVASFVLADEDFPSLGPRVPLPVTQLPVGRPSLVSVVAAPPPPAPLPPSQSQSTPPKPAPHSPSKGSSSSSSKPKGGSPWGRGKSGGGGGRGGGSGSKPGSPAKPRRWEHHSTGAGSESSSWLSNK